MTQSEILGINTKQYASEVGKTSVFDSIRKSISKSTDFLAGLFDNGLEIYRGVAGRVEALKQIDAETVNPAQVVPVAPSSTFLTSPSVKTLAIGAALAAGVYLILKK